MGMFYNTYNTIQYNLFYVGNVGGWLPNPPSLMAHVENARQLKYRCVYKYMYKLNICIYDEKKKRKNIT